MDPMTSTVPLIETRRTGTPEGSAACPATSKAHRLVGSSTALNAAAGGSAASSLSRDGRDAHDAAAVVTAPVPE
jgi:hypothetical protein